ncbi:MAG: DMT family transporter [Terriglobales bacterium]
MTRVRKAHLLLVLVTMIWGASFVIIKAALAESSPLLLNTLRMSAAALALAALYWREFSRCTAASLRAGAVVGVCMYLGYEFQTTGLALTTPSKSAFLTTLSVVLVPVFLTLFWKRHIKAWSVAGVALAFVGLYLLTVPARGGGSLLNLESINLGDLLTLAGAVAFAFHIIFLGRASAAQPFRQIAILQTTVSAVLMVATFPLLEKPFVIWSPRVLWAIAFTGLLSTAAAFTIQAWAQQFTPPTHTALIFSLESVFAWLTSYLVLGERLGARAAVGAFLILGGVLLSELKGGGAAAPVPAGAPAEVAEEG